jgi:DNA (cytosine-5)-methyltransferase 1
MNHWLTAVLAHQRHFPRPSTTAPTSSTSTRAAWRPGERIAFGWFSPDCTDFSKAKGKAPRSERIRGLAWSVIPWALFRRIDVIMLENVEEFAQWGPVYRAGPKAGEPIPERRGETFRRWKSRLEKLGYVVEWRVLNAADYGAPTTRKRLYLVARCDGKPIVWPARTHAPRKDAPAGPEALARGLRDHRLVAGLPVDLPDAGRGGGAARAHRQAGAAAAGGGDPEAHRARHGALRHRRGRAVHRADHPALGTTARTACAIRCGRSPASRAASSRWSIRRSR